MLGSAKQTLAGYYVDTMHAFAQLRFSLFDNVLACPPVTAGGVRCPIELRRLFTNHTIGCRIHMTALVDIHRDAMISPATGHTLLVRLECLGISLRPLRRTASRKEPAAKVSTRKRARAFARELLLDDQEWVVEAGTLHNADSEDDGADVLSAIHNRQSATDVRSSASEPKPASGASDDEPWLPPCASCGVSRGLPIHSQSAV